MAYAEAVHLDQAVFAVSQSAREAIAIGEQSKHPMASVDGRLRTTQPGEGFEGLPIRFNPKTGHLFVDPEGYAVASAEEVVVMGHRVYARGRIVYHTADAAPAREGNAPSEVKFKAFGEHLRAVGVLQKTADESESIPVRRRALR